MSATPAKLSIRGTSWQDKSYAVAAHCAWDAKLNVVSPVLSETYVHLNELPYR